MIDYRPRPSVHRKPVIWLSYLLTFLCAATIYFITAAPGQLWQDSGTAQNRTLHHDLRGNKSLVLSHPLYYSLTVAFQALPFHKSAFKTNLVSAFFGAITVANVFLLLRLWTGHVLGSVIGAISVGVAHTFWQHCALAEVYTVTTTFLTFELICAYRFCATKRARWLVLLFFLNGVGISNHMLASLSCACDGLLLLYALAKREVKWRFVPLMALVWLVGSSLYQYLIFKDVAHGTSFAAAITSATTGDFKKNILNIVPSRRMIKDSFMYFGLNFPTPLVLLIPVGLFRREADAPARRFKLFFVAQTLIYFYWAIRYDVLDQYTFFIPIIMLTGIWIGLGADRLALSIRSGWRKAMVAAACLPVAIYLILPSVAARRHMSLGTGRTVPFRDDYHYFLWPWKVGYHGADRFVAELRKTIPANSLLLMDTTTVETVWYAQAVGKWDPSIEVLPRLPQPGEMRDALPIDYLTQQAQAGRLYVLTPLHNYCPDELLDLFDFREHGIAYHAVEKTAATTSTSTATTP